MEKSKAVFKKRKFKRTFKRKLSMRDIGVLEFLWTWKFEAFTVTLKEIIRKEERPDTMAAIIRKLVQKIEVTESGVVIHYHVGENLFVREFNEELGSDMLNSDPKNKTGQVNLTRPVSKSLLKYKSSNFFYDSGSNSLKIGRQFPTTCNLSQVHDFIEITIHLISHENLDLRAFYEKGFSINEVADRFGLPYSTVRRQLVRQKTTFRICKSVSFSINQRQTFKNSAPPPYGFCYLEGQLQKDPREYPTLQIIMHHRQIGHSPTEIAKFLSGKGLKTRHGITWRQAHVFNIVQRLKNSESNQ